MSKIKYLDLAGLTAYDKKIKAWHQKHLGVISDDEISDISRDEKDVLEGLDLEVAQRIIDFTSGATFAISGNLQKISNYIFLVTPTNVDISGDLQDLLNSSFDVPSIKTRY